MKFTTSFILVAACTVLAAPVPAPAPTPAPVASRQLGRIPIPDIKSAISVLCENGGCNPPQTGDVPAPLPTGSSDVPEKRQGLDLDNCRIPAGFLGLIPPECIGVLPPLPFIPPVPATPAVEKRQGLDEANCIFPAGFAGLIPERCIGAGLGFNLPKFPFLGRDLSVQALELVRRQGVDEKNCIFPVGFLGLIPERCSGQTSPFEFFSEN
ncbi:hypothetical protein DL96DRAFT_887180 [Flagelloscypha sp. PMI_526]|nr:hypothetical protein DL96DRAFT_887180 [Flagelloscypha sp. PMI_526]